MKILYVTTVGETMRFFVSLIGKLQSNGDTVDIACSNNPPVLPKSYKELGCKVYTLSCSRSPLDRGNIQAIRQIRKIVRENNYDVVHCHSPIAAACTRFACRPLRKKGLKVFYTAHGFHFYKGAPLKNWLFYYPVEWLCSFWTDTLITINSEDFQRAKGHLHAKRTEYVPGVGIDLKRFRRTGIDRSAKRKEIGVPENCTLLLSVGELIDRKNHRTVIESVVGMTNVYYAIAGQGQRREVLEKFAAKMGVSDRVVFLGFRSDISDLCEAADVFVFPSFQEGLPVSLMEAMTKGLPVACSKIRGNVDLIDDNGGCLFDPASVDECRAAILKIISIDSKVLSQVNIEKVKPFDANRVDQIMMRIYMES